MPAHIPVFAGDYRKYGYAERGGRDYIPLGTTGGKAGGTPDDVGVVDHVM